MEQVQQAVVVQRAIAATPEKVFAAWTDPALLVQWWGPPGHQVASVEMDLRVNGRYRTASEYAPSGHLPNRAWSGIDRRRRCPARRDH